MRDLWGVLLQTLTVSGSAVLLLTVKSMFRDKLPPKWQLAAWGLLLFPLCTPAGLGRYSLMNWPLLVEFLKTTLTGDYSLTRVTAPIPLFPHGRPETILDWGYLIYLAVALVLLLRYVLSYLRLRLALRQGNPASPVLSGRISELAMAHQLPVCRAVEVEGLQSAFVCGLLSPVLAVPAGTEVDDKVLLHELLHLKHRDVLWGLAACLFRCIHWCNPLLWYCAARVGNDVESACDQRVLERLEGEERRAYGQILLSMANEKYARAPGTTSMANGGKNIRRRIEAIARFKRYPAGMALVSVCVLLILLVPMLGTTAQSVYAAEEISSDSKFDWAMASARTTWCTTPAGALDAYGKALLSNNGVYRAMCAPIEEHEALAAQIKPGGGSPTAWDTGLPGFARSQYGYAIYNLEPVGTDRYQCLMTMVLMDYDDPEADGQDYTYVAYQPVLAEQQEGRWVVLPQGEFQVCRGLGSGDPALVWGFESLPTYVYSAEAQDFRAEVHHQTVFVVDNTITQETNMSWFMGNTTRFDLVPKPSAEFDVVYRNRTIHLFYVGDESRKAGITEVGLSTAPISDGGSHPELRTPFPSSGSSTNGSKWGNRTLGKDWDDHIPLGGGGSSSRFDKDNYYLPEAYAAQLYINGRKAADMTLPRQEGGPK